MIGLALAVLVAVLLATGTYLVLQRNPLQLIFGLGLLTHGINLLLFGTGSLKRGQPPIVLDKAAFAGDISQFVDPMPQSLILTAIVISFGITAFMIALVNRRNVLDKTVESCSNRTDDPFALSPSSQTEVSEDDYEWLEDTIARRQYKGAK